MAVSATPANRRSALSLPNILTYGRLVATPVVVGLMFWPQVAAMRWVAVGVFAVAAITDFFDGYLARAWAQHSSFGRMLDPIADKLLVAGALLALVADGTIRGFSLWAAVIILCREILVSGLREYLAELRVPVPVTRVAKWKTAAQLVAIGFLLAGPAGAAVFTAAPTVGLALLWVAAILTLYTGWDYMRAGVAHAGAE
ncbi:MAG: CDP-diacylglycerol--glycerol-3-phosphate 3-phosphatidyltransferase [Hyphomicrobiales bacterium]|nr:CDP-diacylglycerol--glycerol-3-phosphate 3-phosphatidyltransferase [Hyphomicrobiales bacterium]MDE2016576.1 CDP-diacylglycerol--glycerol-3-phosphate 3-phosphatidyltransferase [Hyphomicrobiales bacterium]